MEPARLDFSPSRQGYQPQNLTFEEISKLDLTKIEPSDQNETPDTPRPSYIYDIFQRHIVNNLENLSKYLSTSKSIHKEIRLNGCELTSAVADKIFLAILSNNSFKTLSFKNGKIDTSVFNALRNAISKSNSTINNFVFSDIELSCESLALLINELQKHPNSNLSFQNCRLSDTDNLSQFYEFLHLQENANARWTLLGSEWNHLKKEAENLEKAMPSHFAEIRHPMSIELINFQAHPDIFLAIQDELLKCNLSMLHIETTNPGHKKLDDINLSLVKPSDKILKKVEKENEALSTAIPKISINLLNERSNKILKYYNIKLSASELAGIIQGLQKHENYRLRLENCKILFNDEKGIENFIAQLSERDTKNSNPLVLELINVKTDLQKSFPGLIKGLLSCNISHLHCQNCNMKNAAAELKNGLMSHKCTLDTLQIVQDQFEVLAFEDIAWGITMQNLHPHPLSSCIFDNCQLNLTHSNAIENLVTNGAHLSHLGFPNNQLGSKIIMGRRRNSSGSVMPLKKEASGEIKTTPPVKSIQPLHPIDSLAKGLKVRLANPEAKFLHLDLSFNNLTGKNVDTIVKTIKTFLPKVVEEGSDSENEANITEEAAEANNANTSDSEESFITKPNIFVNLCGNNAQEKFDKTLGDLLIIKKSSPRSIAIPHTRPSETDNLKSQELNSNYIAATPRDSSYPPTTPRGTVISISPRATSSPSRLTGHKEIG